MRLSNGRSLGVLLAGGLLVGAGVLTPPAAGATAPVRSAGSTPPRPGPAVLYAPPPRAPQLENVGVWKAKPLLISGASAYRKGEFLYQDFLYDDQGAHNGYTYPTAKAYEQNAADLVEVRLKLLPDATAVRITYNTMHDPKLVATTIALGDATASAAWPHGANATAPATVFATAHGATGDLVDAATGAVLPAKPTVRVDLTRRQVEVRIPFSAYDPRGRPTMRLAAASGLWDSAAGAYLAPATSATATSPGGSTGPLSAALFNVAFRYHEPTVLPTGNLVTNNWRTSNQADALLTGDLSPLFATVDIGKLTSGATDDSQLPRTGFTDRIYASHFESAQGKQPDPSGLSHTDDPSQCNAPCNPVFSGQLQPYALYVPTKTPPRSGYGITFELHGAGGNYNAYYGSRNDTALGERSTGSLVVMPNGRSPSSWYYGQGQSEVFELWNTLRRQLPIDDSYAAITGGSMGSHGSYKSVAMYPDLFARLAPITGCPTENGTGDKGTPIPPGGEIIRVAPTYRHVPIQEYDPTNDELCNNGSVQDAFIAAVQKAGYGVIWRRFVGDHVTTGSLDNFPGLVDWMGAAKADPNPAHVTYVVDEHFAEPRYTLTVDHAYWLSGLALRNRAIATQIGTIDVRSQGFGRGDASAVRLPDTTDVLTGGAILPATVYTTQTQQLGTAPVTPVRDQLDITATNIRSVTIDVKRARVSCAAKLNVTSDGPLAVTLVGCPRPTLVVASSSSLAATGTSWWLPAFGLLLLAAAAARRLRAR